MSGKEILYKSLLKENTFLEETESALLDLLYDSVEEGEWIKHLSPVFIDGHKGLFFMGRDSIFLLWRKKKFFYGWELHRHRFFYKNPFSYESTDSELHLNFEDETGQKTSRTVTFENKLLWGIGTEITTRRSWIYDLRGRK